MVKFGDFEVKILVAGQPLKEIEHCGKIYVIAEYDTPVSYKLWVEDESPYGEIERQYWPFTPFEVMVTSHLPGSELLNVKVRIDGVDASSKHTKGSLLMKGFQGSLGSDANIKEFCFSPPRPVKKLRTGEQDPNDKISGERLRDLGSIVITIRKATLLYTEKIIQSPRPVNFAEANKKVLPTFHFELHASQLRKNFAGL